MEILAVLKVFTEAIKGISDASDATLKIDLSQKIIDLQSAALELIQEKSDLLSENNELKEKIKELEDQLNTKASLIFNNSMYWLDGDENPYCPNCYDSQGKMIHLIEDKGYMKYKCNTCKQSYRTDKQKEEFHNQVANNVNNFY